jgi:hypothetical protein
MRTSSPDRLPSLSVERSHQTRSGKFFIKLPDPVCRFVALDVLPYILELANLMIVGTYHEERVGIYDDRWAHRELMQDALSERLKARRLR